MTITTAFEKARAEGRAVLVGCMPAGFPTVEGSIAAMTTMLDAGVDVIEVEIPYSDPVMDGPVIQRASDIALAGTLRVIPALTEQLGRRPTVVVNLSGRGDKDVHTAGTWFGILDGEKNA